jgi:hypothetical protein
MAAAFPKPLHGNQGLVHGTVEREVKPRKEQVACFVTRSFLATLKESDTPPGKRYQWYHCCLIHLLGTITVVPLLSEPGHGRFEPGYHVFSRRIPDTPTVAIIKPSVLETGNPITDF